MKLLENIHCEKGITLNSQLVDLLSIVDDRSLTEDEQNAAIEKYINDLKTMQEKYNFAISNGAKHSFLIENVISSIRGLSDDSKEMLKDIYLSHTENLTVCNKEKMTQALKKEGFDKSIHEKIMRVLNSKDFNAKAGILYLTPEKVRGLHNHMFLNGNRYDRVTFDDVGKYSGFVALDGETYSKEKIEKIQRFCENHNMKSKINALMFYADFPKVYEQSLDNRVNNGEITEEEKKNMIQKTLFDYARNIGQQYGDRVEAVDIFNELIYDPNMKEEGFDESTDEYQYRTQGWHKYLNLEDMCRMALIARKEMPNVKFTYNDMNWTNPDKRQQIIKVIKQIQAIEEKFRTEGIEIDGQNVKLEEGETLIDSIGFESHLSTEIDLDEMDKALDEVITGIGLPIEITELDVACFGQNMESEMKKQGQIFEKIMRIIQSCPKITSLTIWSQSDECSFLNLKNENKKWKNVFSSLLDSNFQEKDFEPTIERSSEYSMIIDSVEEAICDAKTRKGLVKEQLNAIKTKQQERVNQNIGEKYTMNKGN